MVNKSKKLVRSTMHSLKFTNKGKVEWLHHFLDEYRDAVESYVDWLWDNRIEWSRKREDEPDQLMVWDRRKNRLDLPSMISTVGIPITTHLSGRALKCAATQACGIVGAVVEKRKIDIGLYEYCILKNKKPSSKLMKRLDKEMTKPVVSSEVNAELNSVCMEPYNESDNTYDIWLELSSLFNDEYVPRGFKLHVPLQHTRPSKKWSRIGELMGSFLLTRTGISMRYQMPTPPVVKKDKTVGVDQGKTTCITLSDGQSSQKDIHEHDLASIIDKLSRKKWGSNKFKKAVAHRNNYIHWAVNNLNLSIYDTLYLEKIYNIKFGKNVSREMKHFTNPIIRESLKKRCAEEGVTFREVENQCNSIRCAECGWTHSSNRDKKNKKIFACTNPACVHVDDADYNASRTVVIRPTLPLLSIEFLALKYQQKSGFFWNPDMQITNMLGVVLTVPLIQ